MRPVESRAMRFVRHRIPDASRFRLSRETGPQHQGSGVCQRTLSEFGKTIKLDCGSRTMMHDAN